MRKTLSILTVLSFSTLLGTDNPIPCVPGTWSDAVGATSVDTCKPCTQGYTCSSSNTITPSDLCPATYYCPEGTDVASLVCTEGHHCPAGSFEPVPCSAGSYQNQQGQSTCKGYVFVLIVYVFLFV